MTLSRILWTPSVTSICHCRASRAMSIQFYPNKIPCFTFWSWWTTDYPDNLVDNWWWWTFPDIPIYYPSLFTSFFLPIAISHGISLITCRTTCFPPKTPGLFGWRVSVWWRFSWLLSSPSWYAPLVSWVKLTLILQLEPVRHLVKTCKNPSYNLTNPIPVPPFYSGYDPTYCRWDEPPNIMSLCAKGAMQLISLLRPHQSVVGYNWGCLKIEDTVDTVEQVIEWKL